MNRNDPEFFKLIEKLIVPEKRTSDLSPKDKTPHNRIMLYPAKTLPNENSPLGIQIYTIEILIHDSFSQDTRKLLVFKRICELLFVKAKGFKEFKLIQAGDLKESVRVEGYSTYAIDFDIGIGGGAYK
ncbi:hypothetical protein ACI2JA_19655 [Alkalihalobacillus sp. NPDC078783]